MSDYALQWGVPRGVLLVLLLIISLLIGVLLVRLRRRPLPPGPKGSFLAGNADQIPFQDPWKKYAEWSKALGPVIYLRSLTTDIIVLNTPQSAFDLLEKRSSIYSCRPRWPMAELLGRQDNVGFRYYGPQLKKARKLLHGALNVHALARWAPLLDAQSLQLMRELLSTPEGFFHHIHGNVESTVVQFTYGREANRDYIELAEAVNRQTAVALQPGRWLVNALPILLYVPAWAPGAGFQRWARESKGLFMQLTRGPFNQVKKEMEYGGAKASFVHDSLEEAAQNPSHSAEDEHIIMATAGSLYTAATETTVSALLAFFLYMTRNPSVQDRAYAEIISVVGTDRIPDWNDRESLPYVEALIKEIHRSNPAIPLVTHSPLTEDVYLGNRIPKKSWVLANVWAMTHSDEEYTEPEKFMPERFCGNDQPRDPRTLVFGFGRRACPGIHFANAQLYLTIARTLTLFRMSPSAGEDLPPLEFSTGLASTPKPFRCNIAPRTANTAELLAKASFAA